jgi:ElaA protein
MHTECLPFNKLSSLQLYNILHLRSEVFVLEQTCIYQDLDYKDVQDDVHHLMMFKDNTIVAYARLLPAGVSYTDPSIGRILVAGSWRNKGLGRLIIQESIAHTQALWPNAAITIGAQSHLSNLYQSVGFTEISKHYLEDGIPHVDMQLK